MATVTEPKELKAGRALDAEIQERLYGAQWENFKTDGYVRDALACRLVGVEPNDYIYAERYQDGRVHYIHNAEIFPHYSTDIGAAFKVLGRMDEWVLNKYRGAYEAKVWAKDVELSTCAKGSTPSEAICLAALKAVQS